LNEEGTDLHYALHGEGGKRKRSCVVLQEGKAGRTILDEGGMDKSLLERGKRKKGLRSHPKTSKRERREPSGSLYQMAEKAGNYFGVNSIGVVRRKGKKKTRRGFTAREGTGKRGRKLAMARVRGKGEKCAELLWKRRGEGGRGRGGFLH